MLKIFGVSHGGANRHRLARQLLACQYENIWGRPVPETVFRADGKPCFAEGPGYFSISHTKEYTFCAVSDREIGLDAEQSRSVGLNTVRRVLSDGEWKVFSAAEDPAAQFLQFWTLKEAYLKYTGQGVFRGDLRDCSFDVSAENPVLSGHPEVFFRSIRTGNLTLAVCFPQPEEPELCFSF